MCVCLDFTQDFIPILFFIYFIYFIYLCSKWCCLPGPPSQSSSLHHASLPFTSERVILWYLPSMRHQVSLGLGAYSLTEARQVSLLLHMCQVLQNSACIHFCWQLILWDLPELKINWHGWSSWGVAIPSSSFNSSIRVLNFYPMLGCSIYICFSQLLGKALQK